MSVHNLINYDMCVCVLVEKHKLMCAAHDNPFTKGLQFPRVSS